MTATTPVERVTALLSENGYRVLSKPLTIADLTFDVPAALVGTGKKPDLIIVADTAFVAGEQIQQTIESIAGVLDAVQSRRPLTLVMAGPRPRTATLEAISRVCRVLTLGTDLDDSSDMGLHNWLAVLLPLRLPLPSGDLADPISTLVGRIAAESDPITQELIVAAEGGVDSVAARLHALIAAPFSDFDQETAL